MIEIFEIKSVKEWCELAVRFAEEFGSPEVFRAMEVGFEEHFENWEQGGYRDAPDFANPLARTSKGAGVTTFPEHHEESFIGTFIFVFFQVGDPRFGDSAAFAIYRVPETKNASEYLKTPVKKRNLGLWEVDSAQ